MCQSSPKIAESEPFNLQNGYNQYSKGQWAPSLKYYQGKFYLHFIAFNHEKFADGGDFLLTATDPEGEWKVQKLNGFYYDSGLLLDEATGRRFVVAGINEISVTELDENFNAIGSSKRIINKPNSGLEGSHMYHIGDYYYIYATYGGGYDHSQTIFRSKNPFGPYEEHDGLLSKAGHPSRGIGTDADRRMVDDSLQGCRYYRAYSVSRTCGMERWMAYSR